jgi:TfoX/Sxy family transcriptional regulator of competence genes
MAAKKKQRAEAAVDPALLERVREMLAAKRVEEKRMFGGVMFMVGGNMCISVGKNRIMCRFDPEQHDEIVKRDGARAMTMGGRVYRGYVHVDSSVLKTKRALSYWVDLALRYNETLDDKPAAKKRKR